MGGSRRHKALAVSRNVPAYATVPQTLFFLAIRFVLVRCDFGRASLSLDLCLEGWKRARAVLKKRARADKVALKKRAVQLLEILAVPVSDSLGAPSASSLSFSGWSGDFLAKVSRWILRVKVGILQKRSVKLRRELSRLCPRPSMPPAPSHFSLSSASPPPAASSRENGSSSETSVSECRDQSASIPPQPLQHSIVPVLIHTLTDDTLSPLHFHSLLLPHAFKTITPSLARNLWSRTMRRLGLSDPKLLSNSQRLYRSLLSRSISPRKMSLLELVSSLSRCVDLLQWKLRNLGVKPHLSLPSPASPWQLYIAPKKKAPKGKAALKRRHLTIGTYNPGTLNLYDSNAKGNHCAIILKHVLDFDLDLLAIQEHRLRDGKLKGLPPEFDWLGNSRPPSATSSNVGGGSGWLVKKSSVRRFSFLPINELATLVDYPPGSEPEEFIPVSSNSCWKYPDAVERTWLKIESIPDPLFACSIYWPPPSSKSPDTIPPSLLAELKYFSQAGEVVLFGDVNADHLVRDTRTTNLLRTLKEFGITMQNTKEATHKLNSFAKNSLLDWACSSTKLRRIRVINTGDREYGHSLVSAVSPIRWGRPQKRFKAPRVTRELLRDPVTVSSIKAEYVPRLARCSSLDSFHEVLKDVVDKRLSTPNARRYLPPWWSNDLDALILARRQVLHWPPSPKRKETFRTLSRTLRRAIRKKTKQYWKGFWLKINSCKGDPKTIWRMARRATLPDLPPPIVTEPEGQEIDKFWARTWSCNNTAAEWNLFRERIAKSHSSPLQGEMALMCRPFALKEVGDAISYLAKGKAVDPDGLCSEILATFPTSVFDGVFLTELNSLWSTDTSIPECLKLGRVITLFKKGDPRNPANYRPISILSALYRLIETMVYARVGNFIDGKLATSQAGFRKGRSCLQQALLLKLIQQKAETEGKRVYAALLDLRKAFDSVPHSRLAIRLLDFGLPSKMCNLIMKLTVNHVNILPTGSKVRIERGVPQGSILGPFLFDIYVDTLVDSLEAGDRGTLPFNIGTLLYADDTAILATSQASLEGKLHRAAKWSEENRMIFAPEKTVVFVFGPPLKGKLRIKFNHHPLMESKEGIYLGVPVNTAETAYSSLKKARAKWLTLKRLIGKRRRPGPSTEKCVLLFQSLIASTYLFPCVVAEVPTEAQILQNEIAAAILRTMRNSLRRRNHFALGLWRTESVVMYKRIYSLVCWMMPVKWNEMVRPILLKLIEETVELCKKKEVRKGLPWMVEVVEECAQYDVLSDLVNFTVECDRRRLWKDEEEKRWKIVWKKRLIEKVTEKERRWMVGEDNELAPDCTAEVTMESCEKVEPNRVLQLCRGQRGYLGAMILRNRLTLPGEKKSVRCYVCKKREGDNCKHLLTECEGRRKTKVEKETVRRCELARTSRRYPTDLTKEESEAMREVMKEMWKEREKRRREG